MTCTTSIHLPSVGEHLTGYPGRRELWAQVSTGVLCHVGQTRMKCSAQCLAPHRGESHLSGEEVDGKEMASVLHWHGNPAAAKRMVLWT